MVRLKDPKQLTTMNQSTYFNSTMVRLKGNRLMYSDSLYFYFNSTMVRLKELRHQQFIITHLFQFHYGTIKRAKPSCNCSGNTHFNSTMVRLKEPNKLEPVGVVVFQFHYGTIKSLHAIVSYPYQKISIPLWYD